MSKRKIGVDEFQEELERIEQSLRESERAAGALTEVMSRLRSDYNVEDLDAAREKLKQRKRRRQKLLDQYEEQSADFERKFSERIPEAD